MFGYVTLGTNDLERAASFYDALLAEIGAKRMMEADRFVYWATGRGSPAFAVMKPYDGKPATPGNGTMLALVVDETGKVDRLHRKALDLGAQDEGAPGPRGAVEGFYGAYFRDLDGNKLCVFHFGGS